MMFKADIMCLCKTWSHVWNFGEDARRMTAGHPPRAVFRYCWGESPFSRLKMAENCAELEKPQRYAISVQL